MKIGWFTPVSQRTGIAKYSRMVLDGIKAKADAAGVEVIVFSQPTDDAVEDMPFPVIELSDGLLNSDFHALCDVAVYNIGNNDLHHSLIYKALAVNPGVVILHDHVYQHYLAGKNYDGSFVAKSFVSLVHGEGGPEAFDFLNAGGVLPGSNGNVRYIPWEIDWAVNHPMSARLANFGLGTVVHSNYARGPLDKEGYLGDICQLFMPLDSIEKPTPLTKTDQIHIVCGGHIQPTKGLGLLLRALGSDPALQDSFRVTICGFGSDPDYLGVLEAQIESGGLQNTVKVKANVDEEQFDDVMKSADVFYNLRYPNTEGASLSLAEQLHAGRPVIAYRSGSFAEMSDDICYFLEVGSDTDDLAKLLQDIAADQKQLAARGARAFKSVSKNSHLRYGSEIVDFLKKNLEKFKSRQAIVRSFPYDTSAALSDTDAAWFQKFAANRSRMNRFFDDNLLMPRDFSELTDVQRGRFIAATYLATEVFEKSATEIGKSFGRDSVLCELERLGALKHLGEQMMRTTQDPQLIYALRNRLDIWKSVLQMPLEAAQIVISTLLHVKDKESPIFDEAFDMPCTAIISEFKREPHSAEKDAAFADVLSYLKDSARIEATKLEPILIDEDIIGESADDFYDRNVRFSGFHEPEDIGIWTSEKVASLTLRIAEGETATRIVTRFKAFRAEDKSVQAVRLMVREVASDREASVNVMLEGAEGQLHFQDARLDLPDFEGTLFVELEVPSLFVPQDEGLSPDPRNLGLMLEQLEFRGA